MISGSEIDAQYQLTTPIAHPSALQFATLSWGVSRSRTKQWIPVPEDTSKRATLSTPNPRFPDTPISL
jgi:hypothetical protein